MFGKISKIFKKTKSDDVVFDEENGKDGKDIKKPKKNIKKSKKDIVVKKKKKRKYDFIKKMKLSETVFNILLSNLKEDDSYLVKTNTDIGYIVLTVTNDDFLSSGIKIGDEAFGSFVENVNTGNIRSIVTCKMLEDDRFSIILDDSTIGLLEEFSFLNNIDFKLSILPYDSDDDSDVIISNTYITIYDILDIIKYKKSVKYVEESNEFKIGYDDDIDKQLGTNVQNGNEVESKTENELKNDDEEVDAFDDDEEVDVFNDDSIEDIINSENVSDNSFDFSDNSEGDILNNSKSNFYDTDEQNFFPGSSDNENDDYYDSTSSSDSTSSNDGASIIPSNGSANLFVKNVVDTNDTTSKKELKPDSSNQVLNYVEQFKSEFYNDDLGLILDNSKFDYYFGKNSYINKFELRKLENENDNLLIQNVNKIVVYANESLSKLRNDNISKLRLDFDNTMLNLYKKLNETYFNYKNPSNGPNKYSESYKKLKDAQEKFLEERNLKIKMEKDRILSEYNKEKNIVGENARDEAFREFDNKHKEKLENDLSNIDEKVETVSNEEFEKGIHSINEARRTEARSMFDSFEILQLNKLSDRYLELLEKEKIAYDEYINDITSYINAHYSNELFRAEVIDNYTALNDIVELEKEKFEKELSYNIDNYKRLIKASEDEIVKLEEVKDREIQNIIRAYDSKIKEKNFEIEEKDKMLSDITNKYNTFETSNINSYKEQAEAFKRISELKEAQMKELVAKNDKFNRLNIVLMLAVTIVGLSLGLVIGGILGSKNTVQRELDNKTKIENAINGAIKNINNSETEDKKQ